MATSLNGEIEQHGDLTLTSPAFDDGTRMPDSVGFVNENANPRLDIGGIPEGTASLVLILDDPDAEPVAGHTFDHWLVWDIDPDIGSVPEGWSADGNGAVVGYNDFVEQDYGGPSPPEGSHDYRFKLLALDSTLEMPPETRKARLGSAIAMEAEILGATQLVGSYDASQGTAF